MAETVFTQIYALSFTHTARLHFPASLAVRCGHVTGFWQCHMASSVPLPDLTHKNPPPYSSLVLLLLLLFQRRAWITLQGSWKPCVEDGISLSPGMTVESRAPTSENKAPFSDMKQFNHLGLLGEQGAHLCCVKPLLYLDPLITSLGRPSLTHHHTQMFRIIVEKLFQHPGISSST